MNVTEALKPAEAAKLLGRSVPTLERWRRLRVGPPYYLLMGRVRYDKAELFDWIEEQRQQTRRVEIDRKAA